MSKPFNPNNISRNTASEAPVQVADLVEAPVVEPSPVVTYAEPTPAPAPAPVEPTPSPTVIVKETTVVVETSDFDSYINQLRNSGSGEEHQVIRALDVYVDRMAPGVPNNSKEGVKFQYAFWKTLDSLINGFPVAEFDSCWNIVLRYFHEHEKGAFNEIYVFRFFDEWLWDHEELKAYQHILNLLALTANPAKRQEALKRVSIDKTMEAWFTEEGKQRMTLFYK